MSILSPVATKFQSLVKKLSDSALAQALQMHADPSDPKGFWLAQEAMGRSAARKEAQTASANQPTVVQQLAQQLTPQPPAVPQMAQAAPPMPPQGIATAMPPQGMPPQMPAAPMPPQVPPVAMAQAGGHVHDYGVASLPYEPRYEHGGIVSFDGTDGSYVNSIDYWRDGYPELDTSLRNEETDREIDAMFGDAPEKTISAPENEATLAYQKAVEQGSPQRVDFGYDLLNSAAYLPALAADVVASPFNLARAAFKSGMVDLSPEGLAYARETGRTRSREEANPTAPMPFSSGLSPFGFGTSTYDPNRGEEPSTQDQIVSQIKAESPETPAPFNPNWLMSASAAPSLLQQPAEETAPVDQELPPASTPRRIVEITGQQMAPSISPGLTGLSFDPGKPPSPADFPLDETTGKPAPYTLKSDAEIRKFENELNKREGYNPNLPVEFLKENQKDIEYLKKEEGIRAVRDVFKALTQGFGTTTSFAQGLGAFGQALSKNFDESDKVITAKKDAFKKYNRELRLSQNDLARGNVDKSMVRRQKAEDARQAFEQRLADNKNKFILSQYEQARQDYRSNKEQALTNQRLMISERGDTARAQYAADLELRKAEATRATARQDKLNALLSTGLLSQSDYLSELSKVLENIKAKDVARYLAATQGVPIEQIDIKKITQDDVAKYAPIIAEEIVLDRANRSIGAANAQKLGLAQVLFGGSGLGSLGTGYTATPVPR
jgi:hypothetical protein